MTLPIDISTALISYQAKHKKRPFGILLSETGLVRLIHEATILRLSIEPRKDISSGYAFYEIPVVIDNRLPEDAFSLDPDLDHADRPKIIIPG